MKRTVLLFTFLAGPALAVGCPTIEQGHPIARMDGANLYLGDPADNALVAPAKEARPGSNTAWWDIDPSQTMTLICRYDGTQRALALSIPAGVKRCVRDFTANTFACK